MQIINNKMWFVIYKIKLAIFTFLKYVIKFVIKFLKFDFKKKQIYDI